LLNIDSDTTNAPEDFYRTISKATVVARASITAELDAMHFLYQFEFYKIVKIGGTHNPYACIEWLGIQITQAILSLLKEKSFKFTLYNDKREAEEHTLHFYERNPSSRGLEFDNHPDDKTCFVRYAVELRCLNPIVDTKRRPLPPLEDLAEAIYSLLAVGLQPNKEPRQELEKSVQQEGTPKSWFSAPRDTCERDLRINSHLGTGGYMTPGRIQDPKGAKIVVVSIKTSVGAILAVHRQTYKIVCFQASVGGCFGVDTPTTTGGKQDPSKQGRRTIMI